MAATNAYPALCGGTFYSLLLEARKQRTAKRKQVYGERDGLSELDLLTGLVRIVKREFDTPKSERVYRSHATNFKKCENNGGAYIAVVFESNDAVVFDNRMKNDYQVILSEMSEFIIHFIDESKSSWLVKALLAVIKDDSRIGEQQEILVRQNMEAVKKTDLHNVSEICLSTFLLNLWHFIVVNVKDNSIGKETFKNWHTKKGEKNSKWVFYSNIGSGITHELKVIYPTAERTVKKSDTSVQGIESIDRASMKDVADYSESNLNDKNLIELFEDAIDKYNIAEFVDTDYTAMPLKMSVVGDVADFVEYMRFEFRSFRRQSKDIKYGYCVEFVNVISQYSDYMGQKKIVCDDGENTKWLPFVGFEINEETLAYRCELNRLYGLISDGGTLSVYGYTASDEEKTKTTTNSDTIESDAYTNDFDTTESSSTTTNQIANNPIVFNQNGNNNIQIGFIDKLTINND